MTVGGAVAGLVAVVTVPREVGAVSRALPHERSLPEPVGGSPAWRAAWTGAAEALRARTPLLVVGESGSGRRRLLADLDTALHGAGCCVELAPDDAGEGLAARIRDAGASPLVVLRDLDRRDGFPAAAAAALRRPGVRIAATTTDPAHGTDVLPVRFTRSVTVPPLRNRSGDLVSLATEVLADVAPGRDVRLSPGAVRTLARHGWPGNVRELREALEAAVRRRPVGEIEVGDLPGSCQSDPRSTLRPVDQAERDTIVEALRGSGGNRVAAAAALGLARSTLYRKIAQYGIH